MEAEQVESLLRVRMKKNMTNRDTSLKYAQLWDLLW